MNAAEITNIIVAITALVTAINTLVSALHGKTPDGRWGDERIFKNFGCEVI